MSRLADGLVEHNDSMLRCWWCGTDPLYTRYHDIEWGSPVVDDTRLFEKLALEGFQSGLAWITILRKRENFRAAFDGFRPELVAKYGARQVGRLLGDAGIIRHRGKIEATISNARAFQELVAREGSLARFVWSYAPSKSRVTVRRGDIPTQTPESLALSKELKRRGWRFVGPTTAYAFFQAMGLVNDHLTGCHRRDSVAQLRSRAIASLK